MRRDEAEQEAVTEQRDPRFIVAGGQEIPPGGRPVGATPAPRNVEKPSVRASPAAPDRPPAAATVAAGIRQFVERAEVGIVVTEGDAHIVQFANPAFRHLAHAEDRLVIGRPFANAFPSLRGVAIRTVLGHALDTSDAGHETVVRRSCDSVDASAEPHAEMEPLLISAWPVEAGSPRGEPSGLVVQMRSAATPGDVDESAADEGTGAHSGGGDEHQRARRSEMNEMAEMREVSQRLVIGALHDQELAARAEAASEAKSAFLTTMSHELRTPLNAIIGYASLLDGEVWGPILAEQRRHIARITASAQHLVSLIEEVLTLARIDANREVAHWSENDALSLLEEAASLTGPIAAAKRLSFTVEPPEHPYTLTTDRGKVLQILINLIGNAIKFTDKGEIIVSAGMREGNPMFQVRDTGPGISPTDLDHIFDLFWQAEQGPTRRVGGTGIGLNVSSRLAALLGGRLTVESVVGGGSTFTLVLPPPPPPGGGGSGRERVRPLTEPPREPAR